MAHDLILGRTPRDWSLGRSTETPRAEAPRALLPPAPTLADSARAEMSRAAASAIRLRSRGKLPDADWKKFGELHRRWITLSDSRRGRWRESDVLPLQLIRDEGRKFAERFRAIQELDSPPAASPGDRALAPLSPRPLPAPWLVAAGAALALAWTGFVASLRTAPDERK